MRIVLKHKTTSKYVKVGEADVTALADATIFVVSTVQSTDRLKFSPTTHIHDITDYNPKPLDVLES